MKEWIGTDDLKIESPSVVAIGKFDGDHRGHQKIFSVMKELAATRHYVTAVFTFMTPPSAVVEGNRRPQIMTNEERREQFLQAGIEYVVEYPFTRDTANLSGEQFIREILIEKMNMKAIVAGPDCSFGRNRSGNAALLRRLGPVLGFTTHIIEKEREDGYDISSSLIREALSEGRIERANRMLGTVYSVEGTVQRGNHIGGRVLGFPTVNFTAPEEKLLPRFGVYETRIRLADGSLYRGITNVGENPSVRRDRFQHKARVETFLLNYSGNLYGERIRVGFLRFIRPEMKFDSMEALKQQIAKDLESVR